MRVVSPKNQNMLTPAQAAEYLGLSVQTLANWRSSGRRKVPFVKAGAKVLYRRAALDEWLAKNTHTHT